MNQEDKDISMTKFYHGEDHRIWTYCLSLGPYDFTTKSGERLTVDLGIHFTGSRSHEVDPGSFANVYGPEDSNYKSGSLQSMSSEDHGISPQEYLESFPDYCEATKRFYCYLADNPRWAKYSQKVLSGEKKRGKGPSTRWVIYYHKEMRRYFNAKIIRQIENGAILAQERWSNQTIHIELNDYQLIPDRLEWVFYKRSFGHMNQKDKDILKANPVLTKPDFAEQLKQWAKKEAKKDMEQNNDNERDYSID